MIQNLKNKFIFIAMGCVTLLLIVLIGIFNIFNVCYVASQSIEMLHYLVMSDEELENETETAVKRMQDIKQKFLIPTMEQRQRDAIYFTVTENNKGEITSVDLTRMPSLTEKEALEIYKSAPERGSRFDEFFFASKPVDGGKETVFLSIAEQFYSVLHVAALSLLAGVVCWSFMLLPVVIISTKATRPIIDNYNKQKRFITDAGHEIKTPLAIILANAEALELYNGESKWTTNIKNQTVRLTDIMENLLLLARSTDREIELTKEDISFSSIAEQTVESFIEPAHKRHLTIDSKIESGIRFNGVKDQMTNLVSILMNNAVKYSSENSTITVELKKDKKIRLSVKNKCDRLPDTPPENLFGRFYRDDTAKSQKKGGSGIGLSAAKAIVRYHSGEIKAVYDEEENYITFIATFRV